MTRDARYHARKTVRIGPYFRHYSATADRDGVRGGMSSHGLRFRLGPLGTLTYNLTHRRWTWDNPGPGSVRFSQRHSQGRPE